MIFYRIYSKRDFERISKVLNGMGYTYLSRKLPHKNLDYRVIIYCHHNCGWGYVSRSYAETLKYDEFVAQLVAWKLTQ